MFNEQGVGRDVEGIGYSLFEHTIEPCLEELRKTTKDLSWDSQCPSQYSNLAPSRHNSETLPLETTWLVSLNNVHCYYTLSQ
jgi:hypothetical protein